MICVLHVYIGQQQALTMSYVQDQFRCDTVPSLEGEEEEEEEDRTT